MGGSYHKKRTACGGSHANWMSIFDCSARHAVSPGLKPINLLRLESAADSLRRKGAEKMRSNLFRLSDEQWGRIGPLIRRRHRMMDSMSLSLGLARPY